MKKAFAVIMAVLMSIFIFSPVANVFALEDSFERAIRRDEAIAELFSLRQRAVLDEDTEEVNKIESELKEIGVTEVTYDQLKDITNLSMPLGEQAVTSSQDTKLFSYSNDVKYNGEWYTYLVVQATPQTSNSKLAVAGTLSVSRNTPMVAGVTSILETLATSIIGGINTFTNIAVFLYELFYSAGNFDRTTVVESISATYTWLALETCYFTYMPSDTIGGYYIPIGFCNHVDYDVAITIPTIVMEEGSPEPEISVQQFEGTYNAPYTARGGTVLKKHIDNGGYYVERLESFEILGIDQQHLTTVGLLNPDYPSLAI